MLVKLHSAEITQRLPINPCALTSRCCFGLQIFQTFVCFVSVAEIEIVLVSVHLLKMKLIGRWRIKRGSGSGKSKVMEYKVAISQLLSEGGLFVM